jgi:alkylhydroperoxidase AhpD family core domain
MKSRIAIPAAAPDAYKAVAALEAYVAKDSGLPHRLIHLIKLRASTLNGCAYCVDMHAKSARQDGLSEQWITLIPVWHEATVYSDLERAVLGWTDAITLVAQTRAPDADFEALRAFFSDAEIVRITVAIGTINVWNRLAVGMRMQHPVDPAAKAA